MARSITLNLQMAQLKRHDRRLYAMVANRQMAPAEAFRTLADRLMVQAARQSRASHRDTLRRNLFYRSVPGLAGYIEEAAFTGCGLGEWKRSRHASMPVWTVVI